MKLILDPKKPLNKFGAAAALAAVVDVAIHCAREAGVTPRILADTHEGRADAVRQHDAMVRPVL